MEDALRITEDHIRAKTTAKSYERGANYFDREMVEWVMQRGRHLFSEVEGSEWEAYKICVTFSDADFEAACTCPYDWGGYCKHIVATLLAFIHRNEDVRLLTPIENLLSEMNAAELRALIIRMIESDPSMVDAFDSFDVSD